MLWFFPHTNKKSKPSSSRDAVVQTCPGPCHIDSKACDSSHVSIGYKGPFYLNNVFLVLVSRTI